MKRIGNDNLEKFPALIFSRCTNDDVAPLRQKHIPVWKNCETLGKDLSAANVSGSMFPRFARSLGARSCQLKKMQEKSQLRPIKKYTLPETLKHQYINKRDV